MPSDAPAHGYLAPVAGLSNVPTAVVQDGLRSVVPRSRRQVVQVGDDGLAGEVLYALV